MKLGMVVSTAWAATWPSVWKFDDASGLIHQMDLDVLKARELLGAP